jgi:predicted nucleic acid-binding protein
MKNGKPVIYWDTCVFIAWLKDERDTWGAHIMRGIGDVFDLVGRNQAYLVTSAITRTEIFLADLTEEQKRSFADLLRRRNMDERAADFKITDRASEIRYGFSLRTADAIHVGTASIAHADEFQTMDGYDTVRKQCNSGILKLNGRLKYKLLITIPYPRFPKATPDVSSPTGEIMEPQKSLFNEAPEQPTSPNDEQVQAPTITPAGTQEGHELKADTAYPAPVQGSNERRSEGEATVQAREGEEASEQITEKQKREEK